MKKIILIHSYNGDTEKSFAPYIEKISKENNLLYIFPHFPIRKKAKYKSWEKIMDQLPIDKETVIIAHSLGTLFVPKYLAEKNKSIDTFISVAGYVHFQGREDLEIINQDFEPTEDEFKRCHSLICQRYSIYSDNDRMNPVERLEKYAELLKAEKILIQGAGHFDPDSGITEIPEILTAIER